MDMDCVIIGVNCELTLGRCLQSILKNTYFRGNIYLFYVDGGSTDNSIAVAREFPEVQVLEIHPEYPTPGMGRNAGWRAGSSPLVHFFDSDVIVDSRWLDKAVDAIVSEESLVLESNELPVLSKSGDQARDQAGDAVKSIGAVRGNRTELYPDASLFNWIGNLEWNAPPGECDSFGGDVLIRRSILERLCNGGIHPVLVLIIVCVLPGMIRMA